MADDAALRSYLTKATRELQDTRRRLGELEAQRSEPIAIVAMGCRYPGGIDSPDRLWEFVAGERCAVADLPTDRGWDMAALTNPVADSPGATYVRRGHFVDTAGDFDAAFFGISPREALAMDPQQRLLLETTWEALENGGIDPRSLSGSDTGVYMGVGTQEYGARVYRDDSGLAGHLTTGTTVSVASGRISYVLGLNGPAATIDTACSSSLTAIHLAVRALRSGETALAIAGGATVTCSPSIFVGFSRLGALAPDGVCKPFSSDANGFGVAEGVGVLVLQRLSDAQREGRPILAVIRGTAIGQDGASNGLSAPSGPAQQRVIRAALADAGLTPGDVDVVEAHGTGTTLGDPIEADALLATYGRAHTPDRPLLLGSMKANIGHAQAAAGVAGVIKMVEAMRHGQVPAIPGLAEPTPQVDWSPGTVRPVGEATAWPQSPTGVRRAGVSAFGISGTNAHVVLEQAPAPAESDVQDTNAPNPRASNASVRNGSSLTSAPPSSFRHAFGRNPLRAGVDPGQEARRDDKGEASAVALPLAARSESALADQAARLSTWLTERPELAPLDVSYSLATGRSAFEHRAVVVGRDSEDVRRGLDALASGEPSAQVVTGRAVDTIGGPVFVFPGQGSQWVGMAGELLDSAPVFADHIAEVENAFATYVDWSLTDVLRNRPGAADPERVDVVQPALFAVMTSLAKLWESMGVRPAAVIGHSQGEIAAAYVAGALSLADAARVVTLRSKAITALAGRGGMVSVALTPAEVEALIEPWQGRLSIAAVNGPVAVVVSGDSAACDELVAQGEERGLRVRRIPVDYASHSAHVESISDAVHSELDGIAARVADVAFFSTVTGKRISTGELGTAYWYRNLRQQVRFHAAVRAAGELGYRAFIEVSPHPVLTTAIQDALDESGWGQEGAVVESLRRDDGGMRRFLLSAGQAQVRGLTPDWGTRLAALGARRIALPTYAFQHKRYWITDDGGSGDGSGFGLTTLTHPILAASLQDPESEAVTFTGRLGLDTHAWLADHAVHGSVLLPGAALTELAVFAGAHTGYPRVAELVLREPLLLPRQGALTLRVVVGEPESTGARPVRVYSRPAEDDSAPWSRHAEGAVSQDTAPLKPSGAWPPPNAEPIDIADHYDRLGDEGYEYGPSFRGLRAAWRTNDAVLAEVSLPESASGADRFTLHPALLDAALHALGFSGQLTTGDPDRIRLPFSWEGVSVHALGATSLRVRIIPRGEERVALELFDAAGSPVAAIDALVLRSISRSQLAAHTTTARDGLHGIDWQPIQLTGAVPTARDWAELPLAAGAPAPKLSVLRYGETKAATAESSPVRGGTTDRHTAESVHAELSSLLARVQTWLADERFASSTLVVVTGRAVPVAEGEDVVDLVHAPGWGLLRSAQTENPGRILLVDTDDADAWQEAVVAAVASDEPQLAVRRGLAFAPRLVRADADLIGNIAATAEPRWRLRTRGRGTLDGAGLSIEEWPEMERELAPGEVRVGVRATGVNFRDVMIGLGVYADPRADIGGEGAGVVLEVADDVTALRPGDRVMGIFEGIGPEVITDQRYLGRFPDSWTFEEAATTSAVFMTAYFGLRDLAGLRSGETLLVHAATGGVGMAAIQLARAWGVEVYVTASPGKQNTLRAMGFDEKHIGNTRTVEFEQKFLTATGGAGMDVVLDSLAREFVDASLRLLPRGGRFLEMGKTDIRDPEQIAAQYPGVRYRAFDLFEAGPDRVREMLAELLVLFESGTLQPLPVSVWDVRRAPEALRYLSQARHTGKLALRLPTRLNRDGTALVTGGTGVLGALFARHLITEHGIRNLVLLSRRGLAAEGAAELAAELTELGAQVDVVACDTSDRAALDRVLAGISPEHPLTAVLHAAGVLADTVLTAMTPEHLATALRPKVDAAWNLHLATEHLDLAAFVVFSSAAGQLGSPGQANYAAGNVFLDALVQYRRQRSLPALSLAWGWWADATGMTGHLDERDRARMSRSGFVPMTADQGLALFDASLTTGRGLMVPARLDLAALRRVADADASAVPSVLRGLVQATRRAASAAAQSDSSTGLAARLSGLTTAEQQQVVLATVRSVAAAVLGHDGPDAITPSTPFKDLGFDSLGAVEFRNRLQAATGLQLTTTVVFDHATPVALAEHIRTQIAPPPPDPTEAVLTQVAALTDQLDQVGGDLGDVSSDQPELAEAIGRLAAALGVVAPDLVGTTGTALTNGVGSDLSDEELFALIDLSDSDDPTPLSATARSSSRHAFGRDPSPSDEAGVDSGQKHAGMTGGGAAGDRAPVATLAPTWPLTRYQTDIVAVGLRYPELPLTQVGGYLRISGALDAGRMRACVRRSSERHEALRMRVDAAAMTQWISPELPEVEVVDFTGEAEPKRAAQEWMRARTDAVLPLDGPLSEILILVDDAESFVLYGRFHHAVADGWSSALVIRQLCADYLGLAAADLPAPGYPEIVNELQRYRDSEEWRKDRDSLAGQLDGVEPALFPRAATVATHRRHKHSLHFEREAVDRIRATGRTVFAYTATAIAAYLRRIHRDGDIVLGVPMLNRQTPEEFLTVADMVNMLPLRVPVDEDRSVLDLSAGTASAVWELQAHQRFPAGDLHAALRENGFTSGSLFDVTYSYVTVPDLAGSEAIGGDTALLSTGYSLDVVNIVVRDYERDGSLDVDIFYAEDVFDADFPFTTALRQLLTLIEASLADPERPVGDVALLSAAEQERIAAFEAGPAAPLDLDATVDQLVTAQIERTPDHTALVGDGPDGRTWSLTYAEFGSRVRGLTAALRTAGLRPEHSVPVILPRSAESVVAVHAILAAGGAYVPIGVDHPVQRIRDLVLGSGARMLIAGSEFAPLAADLGVHRIDPDPALHPDATVRGTTRSSDLAYVIYTSGSTGVPKGVMIEHLSVVNRLEWMQRRYQLTANDVVLHKTTATFDVSVWELLWWSLTGARAAVLPPGAERDPRAMTEAMGRHGVTVLHFVPSMLGPFLDHIAETPGAAADLASLRLVVCSGEALNPALVNRFRRVFARLGPSQVRLANLYGPTEATVDVSYWDLPAGDEWIDRVPIGRPIDNIALSVLDSRGRRTPIGVPGELNIAGAGVGRGYLGQPEQTLKSFVRDPAVPDGTRYRTGDLARWLADGTLEYLGRLDDQIKVRGNRITLGEIENQLGACPGVTSGVVIDERTADGGIALAAYITGTATAEEAAAHLAQRLPAYMIPSRFHLLEALPLTRSGKVDRRALPSADQPATGITAPRTDIEREFTHLWARVLDRDPAGIGVHDDFFTAGGDSILALRLRTAAEQRGLELDLDELFARPTIADLARAATRRTESGPAVTTPLETVPLIDRASLTGLADAFPATALQLGMLFHSLENSESTLYQDVFTYRLRLPWQEEPFREAYAALLHRHPALRSDFDLTGRSIPLQLVHHSVPSALTIGEEDDLDFDAYVPNAAPLHHLHVTPGAEGITLTLHFHHAILDGWSVATLIRELLQDYLHRIGLPVPAVETTAHTPALLAEYARDERAAEHDATARRYWSELLAGAVPATIASARPYLPQETDRTGTTTLVLPQWLRRGLRSTSAAQGISPKALLTAAHLLTVRAMSGSTDVITGVVSHARPVRAGGDQVAGLFLNTLPLRLDTARIESWADTARAVDRQLRESHRHRRFPLRAMIADHGGPLFDTAFNYVDYHGLAELLTVPEISITDVTVEEQTNFALLVTAAVDPRGDDLVLRVSAGTDGIADTQCDEYAQLFSGILAALVQTPGHTADVNAARPRDVVRLVEAAAGRYPDRIAVADDTDTHSYRWLAETSEHIASRLAAEGIRPGDRVAVLLDRTPELVATVLGIMRAGAAVVPLDPSYPADRRAAVLAHAVPTLVITDPGVLLPRVTTTRAETPASLAAGETDVQPVTAGPDAASGPAGRRPSSAGPDSSPDMWQPPVIHRDSAAYVLFTSGSTGEPKGVVMRHGALANLVDWQMRAASGVGSVTLQYAPLAFDVSLQEIFCTLAGGGTLRLITERHRTDPVALLRTVIDAGVQRMYLPFVALQALAEAAVATRTFPSTLTALISSGDQLRITPEIRALCAANPELLLENQYGPTETHVTTAYSMSGDPTRIPALPPIGRPIDGVRVLLLDDRLRPVARGVTGEIYLGGACLGQGYENRAGLTAQRFIATEKGERLYRTGDLGAELPSGDVVWLGRGDTQVKVRGYRIECAEVELALARVAGVEAAAVLPLHRDGVDAVLAAFLVGDAEGAAPAAVNAELRKTLPHYMIPSQYHRLDAMPVMPNGKRDDNALRALAATPRQETSATGRAPADEHERALAEILAEFAGAASLSADAGFFEAGGTSVGAMRAAMTISSRWGVDIPLETFIAAPTAAGLATVVRAGGVARTFDPLVPLRTGDADRAPVFLIHPIGGNVLCYVDLAESLSGRKVYGIQASGIEPGGTPLGDMGELAASYIEAIRRAHPDGPYHLAGWSFGGYVALEMARQLPAEDLAQVVLLDTISLGDDPVTPIPERDLIVWFFTELLWYAQGPQAAPNEFDTTATTPDDLFDAVLAQAIARGIVGAEASPQLIRRLYAVFRANYEATVRYTMTPLDRDIVVLRAEDALPAAAHEAHHRVGSMFDSPTNGWDRWAARELEVIAVPGDHLTMMSRPHVFEVARRLAAVLDRAEIRNAEVGNR